MVIKVSIFYYHRIGSPESVPIARPLCCTCLESQHREATVCCLTANDFQFGRLVGNYTLTPLSYKFMPNTAISHSICTSMIDSQTPFQASLPNLQSGSCGCSFPKLPGPDGHPLL
ncbi:hypothetical protein HDV62DRAFT_196497 [Trichoderma sp. SZMC 28011]